MKLFDILLLFLISKTNAMDYFDLHTHPSLKGGLSTDPQKYNAWEEIKLLRTLGFLKKFEQVLNSQATLRQIEKSAAISVIALYGLELAFARNFIFNKVLANPKLHITDLDQMILDGIVFDKTTYYQSFKRDVQHLMEAEHFKHFEIVNSYNDIKQGKVNVILSVEGAHSFQSVSRNASEKKIHDSIIKNFIRFKNQKDIRLFHLTLAHLSRQLASVHCFGVKMKKIVDIFPEIEFAPDPAKKGLSDLGKDIIAAAYDSTHSPLVLIDIKHMSLLSRLQFYELRAAQGWEHIPIVASHMGVTGTSYKKDYEIQKIRKDDKTGCSKIFWCARPGLAHTKFNPWTIGLYDEDIIAVLKSNGIIGVSFDQRIIGEGWIYAELMSPVEVAELGFAETQNLRGYIEPVSEEEEEGIYDAFTQNLKRLLTTEAFHNLYDSYFNKDGQLITDERYRYEMIYPIDEPEITVDNNLETAPSHIDYLANNILHILKTGWQNEYDGANGKADVQKSICIGSDLDGLADAMNFPFKKGSQTVNEDDWVTADEYGRMNDELIYSIDRCKQCDPFFNGKIADTAALVADIMYHNGIAFLQKNFI